MILIPKGILIQFIDEVDHLWAGQYRVFSRRIDPLLVIQNLACFAKIPRTSFSAPSPAVVVRKRDQSGAHSLSVGHYENLFLCEIIEKSINYPFKFGL